ncbi:phage major capsid protein [Spirosoma sp. 209]|uniref:phage major capsid protein n=1 Tax=Spirosoma sp. 209 TaxID=1955701 RepID=UPI00098D15CC|nr:phage major capsid protein [Spirosoma sp. 209]
MNEEEVKKSIKEAAEAIKAKQNEIETAVGKKASQEAVDALFLELKGKMEEFEKKSDEAQKQLDALSTKRPGLNGNGEAPSLKGEISQFMTKGRVEEIRAGQKASFTVKAAANMVASNTNGGGRIPVWDREPGVAKQPDRSPFLLDLISVGALNSDTISWVERTDRQGGAAQTAEGDKYSQFSATYTEYSRAAEYSTVYSKVSNKNLDDIDFLADEIGGELVNSLELLIDTQLLSGTGTSPQHKGILTYATTFAKPTGFETKAAPKKYDVMCAAVLQVQNARYYPSAIVLHPTDAANIMLDVNTQADYLKPYFVTQDQSGVVRFMGIPIIENLGMTVGSFLVADFSKAKLFLRRGISVNIWDQNEDDAVKGFKTITGTARAAFRVKGVEAPAFVKGAFSTAVTAITTV